MCTNWVAKSAKMTFWKKQSLFTPMVFLGWLKGSLFAIWSHCSIFYLFHLFNRHSIWDQNHKLVALCVSYQKKKREKETLASCENSNRGRRLKSGNLLIFNINKFVLIPEISFRNKIVSFVPRCYASVPSSLALCQYFLPRYASVSFLLHLHHPLFTIN